MGVAGVRERLTEVRRFRRRVESWSYPLYRLSVVALLASAVCQLALWKVPDSVSDNSPGYFDVVFMVLQILGAAMVLIAVESPFPRQLEDSLQLERTGAILLATVCLTYFASVCINNRGIPVSSGVWLAGAFGLYCLYRVWEITTVIRRAERESRG